MSLLFVWNPEDPLDPGAFDRFSSILEAQRGFYTGLFGRDFHLELQRVGPACVGQIHFDSGVTGWLPWARAGDVGFMWGGICEQFLDATPDAAAVRGVVERADHDAASIAEWDGRFALCTWNATAQRVVVTPAAMESPTLWHTEGPGGWAIGSRAAPLLEMTGRRPDVDADGASVYAAFGYLLGDTTLLRHVQRLKPRQQVILERGGPPVFRRYVSLADYLGSAGPTEWRDRVALAAERLTARIRRQLEHSPAPVLLLTGGHDSRCVAAASVLAGYPGAAYTSGPRDSSDIQGASRVARSLGIRHETSQGNPVRSLDALIRSPERLEQWVRWTEGVDVIRQALPYHAFFQRQLPFPRVKRQLLHGLAGGIMRSNSFLRRPGGADAFTMERLESIIRLRIPSALVLRRTIDPALAGAIAEIAAEVSPADVTPGQWFTLFAWVSVNLRWGSDMLSAKNLIDWHWTPLMDRVLLRASWHQSDQDRLDERFMVDLAVALAPSLAGVVYGRDLPPRRPRFPGAIVQRMETARRVAGHRRVWKTLLQSETPRIWDQVVTPEALDRLVREDPLAEALWCLATAELTARVFGAAPNPSQVLPRMAPGASIDRQPARGGGEGS